MATNIDESISSSFPNTSPYPYLLNLLLVPDFQEGIKKWLQPYDWLVVREICTQTLKVLPQPAKPIDRHYLALTTALRQWYNLPFYYFKRALIANGSLREIRRYQPQASFLFSQVCTAAKFGRLAVLELLVMEWGAPLQPNAMAHAVTGGSIVTMHWLHRHQAPLTLSSTVAALKKSSPDYLTLLVQWGAPLFFDSGYPHPGSFFYPCHPKIAPHLLALQNQILKELPLFLPPALLNQHADLPPHQVLVQFVSDPYRAWAQQQLVLVDRVLLNQDARAEYLLRVCRLP